MYNQEIKERFLREYSNSNSGVGHFSAVFENLSVYEEIKGLDLAEMSVNDVIVAAKRIKIASYKTAYSVQTLVRAYIRWCISNNVFPNCNQELAQFSVDHIDPAEYLRLLWFKDEDDLISKMRSVREFDEGYYEVIALLFAWIGIDQRDILKIKPEDVDLVNKKIRLNDKSMVFSFSSRVSDIISIYNKTKTATRLHRGTPSIVYKDSSYGSFLCKFCYPVSIGVNKLTDMQIVHAISEMNKDFVELGNEGALKYTNVLVSGGLYRVWQLERAGVDVFSIKNKLLLKDAFIIKAERREILWLYQNYKKAFNR